jgi:peptide/nickel transport system permease protein
MGTSTRRSDLGSVEKTAGALAQGRDMRPGRPRPGPSLWARYARHRGAVLALVAVTIVIAIALLTPVLVPRAAAIQPHPQNMLHTPDAAHPLGTDEVGRDILARLMYASRISLTVGVLAMLVSIGLGVSVGALAGYFRGWVDTVLMRLTDALLSIPVLFLLIALAVVLGPSVRTLILAIGALSWMELARIIRANILSLREREFVEAARAIGAVDLLIIARHILPNTFGPVVVAGTLNVGNAMLTEAAVSYLGLGVQPPTPSWGNMLFNAQSYLWNAPWVALYPGLMIVVTVLAINFVGDGLRDALDPRKVEG